MKALLISSHQYLVKSKRREGFFVLRMMLERLRPSTLQTNIMVMCRKIKQSNG